MPRFLMMSSFLMISDFAIVRKSAMRYLSQSSRQRFTTISDICHWWWIRATKHFWSFTENTNSRNNQTSNYSIKELNHFWSNDASIDWSTNSIYSHNEKYTRWFQSLISNLHHSRRIHMDVPDLLTRTRFIWKGIQKTGNHTWFKKWWINVSEDMKRLW